MIESAATPLPARKHATVADAKLAYFDGDFERCLEICLQIHVTSITSASEVALVTARAYLRTGRPREAQQTIAHTRGTHATPDALLTARMLEATAIVRQGDADTGIAMLVEAAHHAGGAHFAIRSEIAFSTALAYWAKREVDTAEEYLRLVDPRSDIIHARALELQAWCHTVRQEYLRAAELFRLTLLRLDDCNVADGAVAATALSTLAIFAAELFDHDIARFVAARSAGTVWSSGLRAFDFVCLEHAALYHEFAGNTLRAYRFATQAAEIAPTVPLKVSGWALMSSLALDAGEGFAAAIFAERAQELFGTVALTDLSGEQRFAMLSLAELCAPANPHKAAHLLAEYHRLKPIDPMLSSSCDPRVRACEQFVAGVVAHAQGEEDRAQVRFREAFQTFRGLGYVRRAVLAANAVLRIRECMDLRSYVSTMLAGTDNFVTRSPGVSPGPIASIEHHPLIAPLPRIHREVVVLICGGKTNREIAALRGVREQTIKNLLTTSIYPAFGVSSRAALVGKLLPEPRPGTDHVASELSRIR